jgi:hypothetical protein
MQDTLNLNIALEKTVKDQISAVGNHSQPSGTVISGNTLIRLINQPCTTPSQPTSTERPILSLLNWPQMSLSLLHWNNVPQLLPNEERPRSPVNAPWWKRASRVLQSF